MPGRGGSGSEVKVTGSGQHTSALTFSTRDRLARRAARPGVAYDDVRTVDQAGVTQDKARQDQSRTWGCS
jgi:hypothetical protein